jgi:MFS family permease
MTKNNSSHPPSEVSLSAADTPALLLTDREKNHLDDKKLDDSTQSVENENQNAVGSVDTTDSPSPFALAMIILAVAASIFLVALDITIIATAIPKITDQFHSLDQVGWYGSAFFLTLGSFQATWGKIYKYFPIKLSYILSIAIFEVDSLICALADNSTTLIIGRAITGLGGAGVSTGGYTIVAFSAPPELRPAFTGVMGATFSVASVIGPLLGGKISFLYNPILTY